MSRIVRLGRFLGHSERFCRVVAVDVKTELEKLAVYAACKAACESHEDHSGASEHGGRVRDAISRLGQWADMAGAALALAEWQINNPWSLMLCQVTYERELRKMWDAFMVAKDKAREVV